eukprot:TRINITY_DN10361_c0_g1_i5.p1 TRINITY_DN10361_c0_g1~~TRINITY_DN10361_c0_g1_i5.p1  ORF type:complete len:196 (+),score=26.13 TRINITY_DN10361_c0_g1_i5:22-588(+)
MAMQPTSPQSEPKMLDLTLPTAEVVQRMKFGQSENGYIVVAEVLEDSTPYLLGVRQGQKLRGVSDPIRSEQVWQLGVGSSFRFVEDAVRMRRVETIQLVLESNSNEEAKIIKQTNSKSISELRQLALEEELAYRRRKQRRQDYFNQVESRNDAPFFFILFGALVAPAVGFLLWAQFTGYLDYLVLKPY